jgi:plasmid maintenance system antidote protein VapI
MIYKVKVDKIAEITGLSVAYVYNFINEHRPITWNVAERLSAKTGIAASWWMRATKAQVKRKLLNPDTWQWSNQQVERKSA